MSPAAPSAAVDADPAGARAVAAAARGPQRRALVAATALALSAHAGLLGAWSPAAPEALPREPLRAPVFETRLIVQPRAGTAHPPAEPPTLPGAVAAAAAGDVLTPAATPRRAAAAPLSSRSGAAAPFGRQTDGSARSTASAPTQPGDDLSAAAVRATPTRGADASTPDPAAALVAAADPVAATPVTAADPMTATRVAAAPMDATQPAATDAVAVPAVRAAAAVAWQTAGRDEPATAPRARSGASGPMVAADAAATDGAEPPPAPLPVYRTAPAPAATLQFELRRGPVPGRAVLRWQPAGARYTLSLQAQALGVDIAGWSSTGGFDEAGLAPQRYVESRRGRDLRATNFRRETQTLSFSAQTQTYPLTPGIQDRNSWMLQLGAVLQANPALARRGGEVALRVAGTRGTPDVWVFEVVGNGPVETAEGPVARTVELAREPKTPYDTQVRIWLDPARHHLPLRVLMRSKGGGETLEFWLQSLHWD